MQFCNPNCVVNIPQVDWSNQCDTDFRKGGISRVVFMKCDPTYVHPNPGGWSNIDNIEAAICAGILFFTGEVLAQKPKGSFQKKRLSSCAPERIISGTKTLTFQDFNADPDTLQDYTFWNAILQNHRFMKVGWITCDDRFYQVESTFDIEVDEVIEDTNDGASFYDGVVTFQNLNIVEPIVVEGLNDFLKEFSVNVNCYGYYGS